MVCLISLNVRGLRNRKKRYVTFRELRNLKADIACLQECYVTSECVSKWEREWGGQLICSVGTLHSKGIMILIRKGFEVNNVEICFQSDRIVGISFTHQDELYKCFCIYAPNDTQSKIALFKNLGNIVNNLGEGENVFICGDFNCTLEEIDNVAGDRHNKGEVNEFHKVCNVDLLDSWRLFHESEKEYTWRHKSKNIMRRIDYIFVSKNIFQSIVNCEHIDIGNTDHRGVLCNFAIEKIQWGKSYWKMNNSFLKEKKYVNDINVIIDRTVREFTSDLEPQEMWEYCKVKVKQYSLEYGKNRAMKRKNKTDYFRDKVKQLSCMLVKEPNNEKVRQDLTKAQIELGIIENVEAEGARIRSKVKWIEHGEKSSKYFLNLEKHKGKQKVILKLKKDDGVIITDQQSILDEQVRFYKDLYKKSIHFEKNKLDDFLADVNIPKLSEDDSNICEGIITETECGIALKGMKNDSSPGLDGITTGWYKMFWKKVKSVLINSLNAGFNRGKLSCTQRQGIICLLHKGKSLPKEELGNWRPLSLTNVDYKLLAKVLALRFKQVINKLINEDQAGFIKGRTASTVLRAIDDVIEYSNTNKIPGIMLALDYSKAFDKISKECMIEAFKIFGFGNDFVKWITVLNTDTVSCINYCGSLSEWFSIESGIRQGCPISPMCFVLACELLSCKIRQSKNIQGVKLPSNSSTKEIKIQQYADDTTLFVNDEMSLKNVLELVESFSKISGLTVNKSKTEAMWIGSLKERLDTVENVSWKLGGKCVKILGIRFNGFKSASNIEENWDSRLTKCENILKSWSHRDIDVCGKIVLVKSLLASQFIYIMQAFICPDWFLNRLNKMFFQFIWSKRDVWHENERKYKVCEKVKRKVMVTEYKNGGLKMLNMKQMQVSLLTKWIDRLTTEGNGSWRALPTFYFNILGKNMSVFKSNTYFKSFKGISKNFPKFYSKLLETWLDLKPKYDDIKRSSILWNNDLFKFKDNVIFVKQLIKVGVIYLKDVLHENGNVLSLNELNSKYEGMKLSYLEYNIVFNAIKDKIIPIDELNVDENMYFGNILVNELKSTYVRKYMIDMETPDTKTLVNQIWVRQFGQIAVQESTWLTAKECTKEVRLQMLHWKILHGLYPTRILLKKMQKVNDDLCIYCNEIEDILHFFFKCKSVQKLWKIVQQEVSFKELITEQTCILGHIDGASSKQDNLLILIAKLSISKFKYGDYSNLLILYEKEKIIRNIKIKV